jgi:hypothetical protein
MNTMDLAIILASVIPSLALMWWIERCGLREYLTKSVERAAQDSVLFDISRELRSPSNPRESPSCGHRSS